MLVDSLPSVRRMLAMNDSVPVEVLYRLAGDPDISVRQGLFVNPKVTLDVLERLIPADEQNVSNDSYTVGLRTKIIRCLYEEHVDGEQVFGSPSLKALLFSEDLSSDILDFIIKHRVFLLADAALAGRNDIPSWLVEEYLDSAVVNVVAKVSKNPHLTEEQVVRFFKRINSFGDKSWMIKSYFMRNPLLPEDLMVEYALTEPTHVRVLLDNPSITSHVLDVVAANHSKDVLCLLVTKPQVSDELLYRLWSDEEFKPQVEKHYSRKWADPEEDYVYRVGRLNRFADFLRGKAGGVTDGMPNAWVFKMFGFTVADWN